MAGDLRSSGKARQRRRRPVAGLHVGQGSSLCLWRKRGGPDQAIGRSRGGRTTKIHGLSDPFCRPGVLHLSAGQRADIAVAPEVLALAPAMSALIGDKGYDGDELRAAIIARGAKPVIPNKSNRVVLHPFNKRLYKGRNVIERCFCRLKDFRRIATRYDKLADRKSTRLNSSHPSISYAVFCLKKKNKHKRIRYNFDDNYCSRNAILYYRL